MLGSGLLLIQRMETGMMAESHNGIRQLADSAGQGLMAIMLAGSANIAHDYIANIKKVDGLELFRILKPSGQEAFQQTSAASVVSPDEQQPFQQALQQQQPVSFINAARHDGTERLNYFVPLINQTPCHTCHGSDHAVRGVFHVALSLEPVKDRLRTTRILSLSVMTVVEALFLLLLWWLVQRMIASPVNRIRKGIDRMAEGDLTHQIAIATGPADELGEIAHDINHLASRFTALVRLIFLHTRSIAACVEELYLSKQALSLDSDSNLQLTQSVVTDQQQASNEVEEIVTASRMTVDGVEAMTEASRRLSERIHAMATATEESNRNAATMAAAAEQMTVNLAAVNQGVADVDQATHQVTASVHQVDQALQQIRARCQQARDASRQAGAETRHSSQIIQRLLEASQAINSVTDLIDSIAEQTNMLALNATIEAAGAGSIGKGFAVVASEVKSLARQTGEATLMIGDRIHDIQRIIQEVVVAINTIGTRMVTLDDINDAIVFDVERQTRNLAAIVASMQATARASDEVTRNASELGVCASEVARVATKVAYHITQITAAASDSAVDAAALTDQSRMIDTMTHRVSDASTAIATHLQQATSKLHMVFANIGFIDGAIHHTGLLIETSAIPGAELAQSATIVSVGQEPFDIAQVKKAHLQWLGKLENVIRGRAILRPEEVASGRQCQFGQWYYGRGTELYGELAVFQQLGEIHLHVHDIARAAVEQVAMGNTAAALEQMNLFAVVKNELFQRLDQLYQQADWNE
ncbi:MAG: CZB domain-containing protein [Magnetococcales bacterium]|nr:CZB domain-containing protein [Magnetococcales bacterium]